MQSMRGLAALLIVLALCSSTGPWPAGLSLITAAEAQTARQQTPRERRQQKRKTEPQRQEKIPATPQPATPPPAEQLAKPQPAPAPEPPPPPPERVEADVSTRSVPIKLGYTGTEIIVFGTVENSRQPSAEAGFYDVIVALEGQASPIVIRRKSNVAGIWMNTAAQTYEFDRVPTYYTIASTRPIDEIAGLGLLAEHAIGYEHLKITPREALARARPEQDIKDAREAIIRIKEREGLYFEAEYDVTFIGRSLFRTTIRLPANIAVGPLDVRVFLFHDGKLLSQYRSQVTLKREGLEQWLYDFANRHPLYYGLFTVAVAISAGLLASTLLRRSAH